MAVSIAQLLAASALNEGDLIEIEQVDGVSRKLTKSQLRRLLFSDPAFATTLPMAGDVPSFNSSGNWVSGATPRWRVIPAAAYVATSPALGVSVAFPGGVTSSGIMRKATDYFQKGDPIRVEIGSGVFYYGFAGDVIEFGVTFVGALLPTAPILSLAVGTPDMLRCVDMIYPDTAYNTSTTLVLDKGCQYLWRGRPGWLASYACSHINTGSIITVNLQMNGGANASLTGVMPPAGTASTRGTFESSELGSLVAANVKIQDGQRITAKTPVITGLGDYLIINMVFVVP
jgi:hypothetical protein